MIVVQARLLSAISRTRDCDLATLHIINDGTGSATRGHYDVVLFGKNNRELRRARIEGWLREAKPAYRLVQKAWEVIG